MVEFFGDSAPLYRRIPKEKWKDPSTLDKKMALARSRSLHFYSFGSKISKTISPLIEILASSFLRSELVDDHESDLLCPEIVGRSWSEVAECVAEGWAHR